MDNNDFLKPNLPKTLVATVKITKAKLTKSGTNKRVFKVKKCIEIYKARTP